MGTSMRGPGAVLWTWQVCDIALAGLGLGVAFKHLEFMLVPLTLAYFLTFLMAPLMDLLEKRPLGLCGDKELCGGEEGAPYKRMEVVWDLEADPDGNVPMYDENRNEVWEEKVNTGSDAFFQMEANESGAMVRKQDKFGEDLRTEGMEKTMKELTMLGKVPHMFACVLTLLGTVGILYALASIIGGSFADFAAKEKHKVEVLNEKSMGTKLNDMGNQIIKDLEEQEGLIIIRARNCTRRNITDTVVYSDVKDDNTVFTPSSGSMFTTGHRNKCIKKFTTFNETSFRCYFDPAKKAQCNTDGHSNTAASGSCITLPHDTTGAICSCRAWIKAYDAPDATLAQIDAALANTTSLKPLKALLLANVESANIDIFVGVKIENFVENLAVTMGNCSRVPIFGAPDPGMEWGVFTGYVGMAVGFLNELVLVVLLAVYILLERPEGSTVGGDHRVALEIENMIKMYINLKTALSFGTGVLTATILLICEVPLAAVFGLMAFLLNYIPNVGSIIAMMCPVPIIILDENMSTTKKIIAFAGPALVQGYVGNALEPAVFGKSLNMTEMSVLLALVFFAGLWGLSGAVLSVPFLGIMKIVAHHTEHPLAKHFLGLVRADAAYA